VVAYSPAYMAVAELFPVLPSESERERERLHK
jgi:hypothetical protein